MVLPFLYPESIERGLMCISYTTIKSSLSGNEMGHMCEWGVFPMTAEQFRDTWVLDLVSDFEGAWRSGASTPFCTNALASLLFSAFVSPLVVVLAPLISAATPFQCLFFAFSVLRAPCHLPPFHSSFSHIYPLISISPLFN